MTPAFRPLLAMLALTLVSGSAEAAKKPAAPAAPAACADFYGNVNAAWLKAHPLPAGADSFSRWDELNALAAQQTRDLTRSGTRVGDGRASALLADLIASGQDENGMDAASKAALAPLLARVDAIKKPKDLAQALIALQAAGVPVVYDFDVLRDPQNGQPRATLIPNGLGLADPAFYGSADPELQRVGGLYRAYLADLLKFSGVPGDKLAEQTSQAITLENELAQAMAAPTAQSQSPAAAAKAYPQLLLADFLKSQGVAAAEITIQQPNYFRNVDRMIAKTPVPQWKAYLRAQILHSMAPTLASDYRRAYASLVDDGIAKRQPRTQTDRVALLVQEEAADLLSAAYAERYVSAAQEQKADAIGAAIRAAGKRAIDRATWLDADAKTAANKQLDAMYLAIGKPMIPVAFTSLAFNRDQYAANVLALRRWQRARAIARLERPIWPWPVSQTHPVVGFEPAENRLIVTAAALQAPVFSGQSDGADYGALGALMAQQISTGMHMPANVEQAWATRSQPLVAQYNAYTVVGANKVNGERTRAQNAADLVGVEIAWDAFNTQSTPDFAAKKAFFVAWGSLWARQDRDAALVASMPTATYAPAKWRVNGTVVNQPLFPKIFACKAGQPMFKADKDMVSLLR
ncbi:M13 family metallopeptidase [Arenimonas oryziterrae]|uniref:Peptidase M13 N-terminal domain-containing protein n=1 Tax=Arenimonas oryziterrae DSM 21050 = YC6267 TaxID=1121015 RepID=A0A091B1Y1_9GAMM|nr:M13 family metallopeptidase [Arenimonas oryziterrae]KFN44904.1 hypothetical protein N789_02475 [Arenimonas oryziterrae DSM 21050 = YC6267]